MKIRFCRMSLTYASRYTFWKTLISFSAMVTWETQLSALDF
jgi:hypothetical protein